MSPCPVGSESDINKFLLSRSECKFELVADGYFYRLCDCNLDGLLILFNLFLHWILGLILSLLLASLFGFNSVICYNLVLGFISVAPASFLLLAYLANLMAFLSS